MNEKTGRTLCWEGRREHFSVTERPKAMVKTRDSQREQVGIWKVEVGGYIMKKRTQIPDI